MPYVNADNQTLPESAPSQQSWYRPSGDPAGQTYTIAPGAYAVVDNVDAGLRDTLMGGQGDDIYYLGSNTQVVNESNDPAGIDTISIYNNFALPAGVENLTIANSMDHSIYGEGNAGANLLIAHGGMVQLAGGAGDDVLVDAASSDHQVTFVTPLSQPGAPQGSDVIYGFTGGDVLRLQGWGVTSADQAREAMTTSGSDVVLTGPGGQEVIFRDTSMSAFQNDSSFQVDPPQAHLTLGSAALDEEFNAVPQLRNPYETDPSAADASGLWRADFGNQPWDPQNGYGNYSLPTNGEQQVYISPYYREANLGLTPFSESTPGILTITAAKDPANVSSSQFTFTDPSSGQTFYFPYTSGLLTTRYNYDTSARTFDPSAGGQQFMYGYFEMRAQLPATSGTWPAFWLLPTNPSTNPPAEIDVMEQYSDKRSVQMTVHDGGSTNGEATSGDVFIGDPSSWHTYGLLWTSTELIWTIDGAAVFEAPTPSTMTSPMYLLANLAIDTNGGAIDESGLPAQMNIDYIRAWSLNGDGSGGVPAGGGDTTPGSGDAPRSLTETSDNHSLAGAGGADTLTVVHGADTLTGGGGADHFVFSQVPWNPSEITDFAPGVDKLDVTALLNAAGYSGSTPIEQSYIKLINATDGSGTWVYYDSDGTGAADQYGTYIAKLDGVAASSVHDSDLTWGGGSGGGMSLQGTDSQHTLTGGAGNDTLVGGHGPDTMTGGGGADHFVFSSLPWTAGEITDFVRGTDKIDVSGLLQSVGWSGTDATQDGYIKVVAATDGSGAWVYFDSDGPGTQDQWGTYVVKVDGVTGLTGSDFIF